MLNNLPPEYPIDMRPEGFKAFWAANRDELCDAISMNEAPHLTHAQRPMHTADRISKLAHDILLTGYMAAAPAKPSKPPVFSYKFNLQANAGGRVQLFNR